MDKYRIENVVCYPFRTAILVDNGTIEGQIGEGCRESVGSAASEIFSVGKLSVCPEGPALLRPWKI